MSLSDQELRAGLDAFFAGFTDKKLGVAVSGGSDSTALLHGLAGWARDAAVTLCAVTVDHGLRTGSADEAAKVARACAALDVDHQTLVWGHWDGAGNLQDQARRARYRLIADWARGAGIEHVALGHTADDQAETFLMRLAREAGVDGLSAMAPKRQSDGVAWVRPLLGVSRADLRAYLRRQALRWVDDPSNENEDFDRIKARRVLAALAPLGIDQNTLANVAAHLREGRRALQQTTLQAARRATRVEGGDVIINMDALAAESPEIWRRLFTHSFKWVSSADYGARSGSISRAISAFREGGAVTLQGCATRVENGTVRIFREYDAVKETRADINAVWDGRWLVSGPENKGLHVAALGADGLAQCPDWRATGHPREALLATPAIWKSDALVAAPLAGAPNGWHTNLRFGAIHYLESILAH